MAGTEIIDTELLAMIALDFVSALPRKEARKLVSEFDSARTALKVALRAELIEDDYWDAISSANTYLESLNERAIKATCFLDEDFPQHLLTAHDHPNLFYYKGSLSKMDAFGVAIVGTRSPSDTSVSFTHQTASALGMKNVPVISGLARGIDTVAMRASISNGNRTIGVLGNGLDTVYPPENAKLQHQIATEHLLLSQFRPETPSTQKTFPMRNVFMSAYSSLTLIVEAGEHSGTRIQAKAAIKQGRPLLLAETVIRKTTWGRELAESNPSVIAVDSPQRAIDEISTLLNLDG